jgi:enoyl-CoA hydratase
MVRVERQGAVVTWTISRPEAKNALNFTTMMELSRVIAESARDRTIRCGILAGEGGTFVSGGDLRELRTATKPGDAERLADMGRGLCHSIGELEFPVIAALSGPAIGGGAELAVACDLRIAQDGAKICFKQVRMGVTTAWGTFPRLIHLVGPGTAARLVYTAHEIRAMEARAMGLVDWVADDAGAGAVAHAWAMDIAQGSPAAIASMKALFREAQRAHEHLAIRERDRFVAAWNGPDHHEAMEAFFSSRAPKWRDR